MKLLVVLLFILVTADETFGHLGLRALLCKQFRACKMSNEDVPRVNKKFWMSDAYDLSTEKRYGDDDAYA
jgi:hypothetical protein